MSDSQAAIRAEALESLLVEKGLLDTNDIDAVIEMYNERVGPMNGARVVAKAWRDTQFKSRLMTDATSAIEEFEFEGGEVQKLVVVENTDEVHNLVVCTLCSCYPWAVLGLPPKWYKDPAYRSRVVREPRVVLTEFGVQLLPSKKVRVWDSSAEIRYMVLPQQPQTWLGLDEEALASKITRDSMIGG
ncbi:MAG: nitrile hydratase subunit alpha [Gammaproteobacteria bacterium]|nr:nitrile hydratase subunit alpha [Gammaproteobacteria bacterium]